MFNVTLLRNPPDLVFEITEQVEEAENKWIALMVGDTYYNASRSLSSLEKAQIGLRANELAQAHFAEERNLPK